MKLKRISSCREFQRLAFGVIRDRRRGVKTNVKAGRSSDNIMWTVKFRDGSVK
jgi:hypothetical protein